MSGDRALLEICVDEPASVAAAIAGGADRLELCSALAVGGLTPTLAFTAAALSATRAADVTVHAMVRPRAGDFAYHEAELAQAIDEARALLALGVDGLVFGAARDGVLDRTVLARWVEAVRAQSPDASLTLHRAIDTVADPVGAVAEAAALGFARVLTSGGARSAPEGAAAIARMVAAADGKLSVMAGAGVTPETVSLLLDCGVREVHASASRPLPVDDERLIALGFADPPSRRTDRARVSALRAALDQRR